MSNQCKRANAVLPEDMERATIGTMMTGDRRYVVPWAMWVDAERSCWLHPDYDTHDRCGGTVQMRVELREDGYHVWPVAGHGYRPQSGPGYFGGDAIEYLSAAELHR